MRKLLPIIVFIIALPICIFGQVKADQSAALPNQQKVPTEKQQKPDPARVMKENQQKKRAEQIKSVPITNRNIEAIRFQNKKATMEQMHTINKAIRKSMTIHKHR